MKYYTLQPGPLTIIQDNTPTAALDPLRNLAVPIPSKYALSKAVQLQIIRSEGSVTLRYVPRDPKADFIEISGSSIADAERLMRSAFGQAWRKYVSMTESSPHVNGRIAAMGKELSDLIEH